MATTGYAVELAASEDVRASFLSPVPLDVSRTDLPALARVAVELLVARIAGDDRPPQTLVLPVDHVHHGPPGRRP